MKVEIKVPAMGESISEATISRIIKPTGSVIRRDEEVLELETDKVNQVLYAPEAGRLSLSVKIGDTVKIGQVVGTIDTAITAPASEAKQAPALPSVAPATPINSGPSSRKMAPDVLAEMKAPKAAPVPSGNRKRMSSLRRTIAQKLVEVKNTTAMLTTFNEVDMTKIIEIRTKEQADFQARNNVKLGFMSFFIKAAVSALKTFPDVHSYIEEGDMVAFPNFDIGVAVSTEKGLLVPVVRKCDSATLGEIEKQIVEYSTKAKTGAISIDDLRGGCFTITNGGTFGSLLSTPILNPPQSAILGMHAIQKRPIALNDQVVIRPMMYLALSYDHRIIDGKEAVQFLVHMKDQLEKPHYEF
ncbi:MAG TPA: dihydrolipoyllysine-residue succinyltransferase [Rhabdochlamydiaceae bacterium]|jgi:2-oxoglutarate dehydrogenase E2 component (dihydrolipoamide succinyltransferase)|nr:dihydrolipoyllysine-residue succinyltransferase [Rhabdochlamydiaceae bacterium]